MDIYKDKSYVRAKLKHTFLKSLTLKVEFDGLIDLDVENFVQSAGKILYKNEYNSLEEVFVDDNDKNFVFKTDNGRRVTISKENIILEINTRINNPMFSNYLPTVIQLIKELKKFEFINIKKIGLQKVNTCIIYEKDDISKFFAEKALHLASDDVISLEFNEQTQIDNIYFLYNRTITKGRVGSFEDNRIGYQILLDIEGFMPIVDELDEDNLEKSIKKINNQLYDLFFESLSTEFIKELSQDEFNDGRIAEVTKNGKNKILSYSSFRG